MKNWPHAVLWPFLRKLFHWNNLPMNNAMYNFRVWCYFYDFMRNCVLSKAVIPSVLKEKFAKKQNKTKKHFSNDSEIPLLGIYPREIKAYAHTDLYLNV